MRLKPDLRTSQLVEHAFRERYGRAASRLIKAFLAASSEALTADTICAQYSKNLSTLAIVKKATTQSTAKGSKSSSAADQAGSELQDLLRSTFIPECRLPPDRPNGPAQQFVAAKQNSMYLASDLFDRMARSDDSYEDREADMVVGGTAAPWIEKVDQGHSANDGGQTWRVNYWQVHRCMKRNYVVKYVHARWGKEAARIVRILDERGKLDDKSVRCFFVFRQNCTSLKQSWSCRFTTLR